MKVVVISIVMMLLLLPALISKPTAHAQSSSQCMTCALNCYVVAETLEFQCLQNGGDELECR